MEIISLKCKSSLGIKRSGNAVFTEVLSEIKEDTNQIIDISENILVEKQIARLDRDWEKTKASFTTYRDGNPSLPEDSSSSSAASFLSSLVGLGILIFLFLFMASPSKPSNSFPNSRVTIKDKSSDVPLGILKKQFPGSDIYQGNKRLYSPSPSSGPPIGLFFFFFFLILLLIIFSTANSSSSAKEYNLAKAEYEAKRQALLEKLEEE